LDRRLGGPQRRSGRGGEEKNSQPPPGIEPPITQHSYTLQYFYVYFYAREKFMILCTVSLQFIIFATRDFCVQYMDMMTSDGGVIKEACGKYVYHKFFSAFASFW
jgi:hypothetical protein